MNKLERIGHWDGVTGRASLEGPYEDWLQQEVPFGLRSFFLAPWRAYMDTWDYRKYADVLGINFNVNPEEADATAQVLAEAGIRSLRLEIGWRNLAFDNPATLEPGKLAELNTFFGVFRKYGLRPIILLNANSGLPVPYRFIDVQVTQNAPAGTRELYVANTNGIRAYYTGLQNQRYHAMFPVITQVNVEAGRLTLSAPLPQAVSQGGLTLIELKYQPFAGTVFADGRPNPAAQETLDGWMQYVRTVTGYARSALGTEGQADAGFDLEVWNEYTFGSEFLDINNYYDPPLSFSQPITYTQQGRTATGAEAILPMTIDYVKAPQNGFPGVRVINGFSNQRPWDNGTELWHGQDGFSRHYYTSYSSENLINPATYPKLNEVTLDATGQRDGAPDPLQADRIIPGTNVIPTHFHAMPEDTFFAYQTEFVVRDIQPFPGPWFTHHRYSNRNNGQNAEVWMTETNFYRLALAQELAAKAGVSENDPRITSIMHYIGAKATLRIYMFYGHKGIQTVNLYAVKENDTTFALLPSAFFAELANNGYQLTESVRAQLGPQASAVTGITSRLSTGTAIAAPRPLKVEEIVEPEPRVVFEAHGTKEHPHRYHRDDLAVLPFQLDHHRFAVGYYVVTRNMAQSWDTSKDWLDADRYRMQPQAFELTLSNVKGNGVTVSIYDPMTGEEEPAVLLRSSLTDITVQVMAVDYPRLLLITEAGTGPMLQEPRVTTRDGRSTFSFVPNVDGAVTVSWGAYPVRSGGSFLMEEFAGENLTSLITSSPVSTIQFYQTLAARQGSWRWTGLITPAYREDYTFLMETDNYERPRLWIEDQLVIPGNGVLAGSIRLQAGRSYRLTLTYSTPYASPHTMMLFWGSASQPREAVAPSPAGSQTVTMAVTANQPVTVELSGLQRGDGVKARFTGQGLEIPYPRWNYDVQGVLWE
ncbi:hypothetical protein [Paenibacillus silviterrae]|uniref:hypothetical protein n=1 Tax=Paenibacillus silviterrae TaxID=3242194 RepID=UPI002542F838|nr:hypothetical protein [Paenibacillus chinjuensis]